MVIHVHTRIRVQGNLVNGPSGLTGQIVPSHVAVVPVSKHEPEWEMKNVLKLVKRLKVVTVMEANAVVHVIHGEHGQHAIKHVMVEPNQEVEHVVQEQDVPMRHKVDHVMMISCAAIHVLNGVLGVIVVSLVNLEQNQDHELVAQNQDAHF